METSILDSLPYYDNDLETYPLLKQKVERELARQAKAPTALHPNVPPAYELFSVCILCHQLSAHLPSIRVEQSYAQGRTRKDRIT